LFTNQLYIALSSRHLQAVGIKFTNLKPKECTATHKRERTKIERRKDKMNYKTLMFEEKMSSFYFILASLFPFVSLEKQHTPTSLM
jgi:hypothetical protein